MSAPEEELDVAAEAAAVGLTADELTAILRGEGHDVTITAVGVEPVGTGQMGRSYRLTPTYEGGAGDLPATFVAKVHGVDPDVLPTVSGAYRTEVGFYRHVAETVAVRVPHCWHAHLADDATFLLLLEDLAPSVQGDQIAGCDPAAAARAVVNLAGLHGPRWCDPTLVDDGLATVSEADATLLGVVLSPMTEMFISRFEDRLAAADVEVLRRSSAVMGDWLMGRPERTAAVHGDYRLDNLMFAPDDGPVTTVDWQTVSIGLPARDLAFFCSTSLTVAHRRAHEDGLIAAYHEALLSHGVTGHPLDECRDDYRYGLLQAPLIIVLGCGVATPTDRGDAMFMAMVERSCAALRDHDPFALL